MKKVLLKIEKLKVKANEKEILKGIDLKINSREIQALLGPNASGKSVDGNQRIILLDSLTNQIWYPKISMFIDRVINSLKTHGSNSSGAKFLKKRYFTLALNPITQKVKLYPITSVLRHRNAETLLKITTRTGRDIIVTKDHSLYTLKGVNVIPVESNSLKEGDYIVVAKKLNFDLKLPKTIDILNYFKNNQKIFVKVDERLSEKLVEKFPYLKRSWWYYSGHRKIPISLFLDLIEETKVKLKIHNHIRVGFKQGLLITPKIPLNGEFARLLGYFIAEGNYSKEYRDGQISNTKKEIKEDIKMCLKNVFGIEKVRYKKRGSAIFFPKIIAFVFHKIFNLPVPCCAENKFIPKIILGSDKLLSSFLRAYFSGNGEVNVAKRYVSCSTKSKDLVDHLIVALLKFGIFSMVDTKTNKKYGQYHTLTIYGDYLKQFRDKVGFTLESHNRKLNKILEKETKTYNVDVVPLSKQLFRILRLLNISQKSKLGKTLQTFYAGNHSFSRTYVLRVLRQMENEIKKIMKVKVNEINHLRTPQRLKERINLIKKIKNTWKFKWSNISKLSGLSYQGWIKKTLSGRIKNPSESRMRRLIDSIIAYSDFLEKRILLAKGMIEKIKQIVSSDLFFDKITVIQKVKSKKYVYDLEIKHNNQKIENFVVFPGCFIAHNSTLAHTILGNPKYKITEGKIFFEGKEINKFPPEKRVKLGLSLAWQSPPVIKGVKLSQLLKKISKRKIEIREVKGLLEREINLDFSGGEKKISELLQVISLNPKFVIFDEIDSGLDIKRLEIVSEIIKKELLNKNVSILLITHWGQILDYLKPDLTNVMLNGRIICQEKDFKKVLEVIKKYGYEKCKECPKLLAD